MPKTKASLWVIAATVMTVLTLFLLPFTPKAAVRTATVERGDLIKTVLLEGVVSYSDEQPCLAAQTGRVSAVYVRQGQRVEAGELLFSLDTSAEEEALATITQLLYEQKKAIETLGASDVLEVATLQSSWETIKTEKELLASIELKQVRAASDGIVGGVYTTEGAYVSAMSLLGTVRGESKKIMTIHSLSNTAIVMDGAPADVRGTAGESLGAAVLTTMNAPAVNAQTAQYTQQLTFTPTDEDTLANVEIGERVVLEMLVESMDDMALVPVSAIGGGDKLWIVEEGVATPIKIDVNKRNEKYVCVPQELVGKRVILAPDQYALQAGCAVKEAKKR